MSPINNIPISFYRDHRYFRHIVQILEDHPHVDELLSIHAAVLVRGNNIIAIGKNQPKTNGLVRAYAPHDRMTIHAEVDCILKARRKHDLNNTTIYVGRKYKNIDTLTMSQPCSTCHKILQSYGVRHIYFTNENGQIDYLDGRTDFRKKINWNER